MARQAIDERNPAAVLAVRGLAKREPGRQQVRDALGHAAEAVPLLTPTPPPTVPPELWEDFPAFRETFLLHVTRPEFNVAFRGFGLALYALTLEADPTLLPALPDQARQDLAAAAADLRHLQGFLAESAETCEPPARARLARRAAAAVGKIAASLEATP